jgi:dolichol-phosphate mannosyltransferase
MTHQPRSRTAFRSVYVVLPTYNERDTIHQTLRDVISALKWSQDHLLFQTATIVVIDDKSPDGTLDWAKKIQARVAQLPHFSTWLKIRCEFHDGPPELGDSILQGIRQRAGEVVIGMDADGNHEPHRIPVLLHQLLFARLVVGSRFLPGGGMAQTWRQCLSLCFNTWLRLRFHFPIWDNTSGFYAIRTADLLQLDPNDIYRGYGEYHLRLVKFAQRSLWKISEVSVYYPARTGGVSKSKLWQMAQVYLAVARQLTRFSPS